MNLQKIRRGRAPQIAASALAMTGLLLTMGLIEEVPAEKAPVSVEYAGDYLIEDSPETPVLTPEESKGAFIEMFSDCLQNYADQSADQEQCKSEAREWYRGQLDVQLSTLEA